MEEEKNINETELSKEEELETTEKNDSSESDNLEKMKKDIKKKSEKKYKKMKEQQAKGGKKCKISAIVAAIAGGLELIAGLSANNSMSLCLGLIFICMAYFYYNLGKKYDKHKDIDI